MNFSSLPFPEVKFGGWLGGRGSFPWAFEKTTYQIRSLVPSKMFGVVVGGLEQSMAIYIAILGLVPNIEGFSHIVVLVLNIEGEFVPYIVGVTLVVQNFSEIFCIDFVGLLGSKCILRIY